MSLEQEQAFAGLFDAAADALGAHDADAKEHEIHYMLIAKRKGAPFAMATNVEPDMVEHFLAVFGADVAASLDAMKKAFATTNAPPEEPPGVAP